MSTLLRMKICAAAPLSCHLGAILLLFIGLNGCRTQPGAVADHHPALASSLDQAVRAHPQFFGSVLVVAQEDVMLREAYGNDASGRPIEPDTPFWIASISKQFTAAAILKLRDERKLSLDDPITRFFDDVPKEKRVVSVRQLLEHRSGLGQNYAADGIVDRDAAVAAILARPLERLPGEAFRYSNDNYNLLAAIIEVASRQPFDDYLRTELFQLAGMEKTHLWGAPSDEVAAIDRSISEEMARPNWGYRGATGIASTTEDLLRWVRALRRGHLLSQRSVEEMLAPAVDAGPDRWHGYGWFTSVDDSGHKTLWTRGYEDTGHGGFLAIDSEGSWIVIVLSSAGAGEGKDGYPLTHVITPELVSIVRGED